MFDEGIYEDKNYRVNLQRSIIICTSNFKTENEIKSVLGEPIYARFDDLIRFDNLSAEHRISIIEREYQHQINQLNPEERAVIERLGIEGKLIARVSELTNVRHIKRVVKQAISAHLIRSLFDV